MKRIGLLLVGTAVLAVAGVVVAILSVDTTREATIPLREIPEGVSFRTLGQTPVFLVRDGDRVEVLVGRSTHLRERLHWCIQEELFYDPRIGGDLYDVRGLKVAGSGPAPRDLDKMAASIRGTSLVVRTNPLVPGAEVGPAGGRGKITSAWERSAASGDACRRALPPA